MHSLEAQYIPPRLYTCNHTELYQICRRAGIPVHPAITREEMMALLVSELPDPIPHMHPIDSWRHGLAGFVLDHWKRLQNQVTCPLKSADPIACFGCLDAQVITCIVKNPSNEPLIRRYKK